MGLLSSIVLPTHLVWNAIVFRNMYILYTGYVALAKLFDGLEAWESNSSFLYRFEHSWGSWGVLMQWRLVPLRSSREMNVGSSSSQLWGPRPINWAVTSSSNLASCEIQRYCFLCLTSYEGYSVQHISNYFWRRPWTPQPWIYWSQISWRGTSA